MRSLPMISLTLLALSAACRGERVEQGVETRTSEGRLEATPSELAERRGVSLVRMINALPESRTISVSADDNQLFADVSRKGVTAYVPLNDNVARFRVKDDRRDTTIASDFQMMMDGSHYTVVTLPEKDGAVKLRILRDDVGRDSAMARVRFVHGSPMVGSVEVVLDGRQGLLFDNVSTSGETGFQSVVPTNAAIRIRTEESRQQVIARSLNLVAGHSYTVVLTGSTGTTIDMIVVDDRLADAAAVIVP